MTGPVEGDIRAALSAVAAAVERRLDELLPPPGGIRGEAELRAAMRHAVLGGGKRLRAFLVVEAARLFGAEGTGPERVAAAVECLHAYSLVHDDLPCMDDADLRRGRPTVHRVWNEATAVLAGDALQALAFEILAEPATHADPSVRAALVLRLAEAAGAGGMVGGQAIDMAAAAAGGAFTVEDIERLEALKTGALFAFAAEAGAIVAGAGEADRARLHRYGIALGEAFQIADDLLDASASEEALGKPVGQDAEAGKATLVALLGPAAARARALERVAEAEATLAPYAERAGSLTALARHAVERSF